MKLSFIKISVVAFLIYYSFSYQAIAQINSNNITTLKSWPIETFLEVNHPLSYEGSRNGEARKYYSNATSVNSGPDTALVVFDHYLVLITYDHEAGRKYHCVYDFTSGLIDTSKLEINLPIARQAKCSFAYYSDEMTELQSIWKDKLFMVSSPDGIVTTLDIYNLKNCLVKKIAQADNRIIGELIIKDDRLFFYKIEHNTMLKDTLYDIAAEYEMNLSDFKTHKTGKESRVKYD